MRNTNVRKLAVVLTASTLLLAGCSSSSDDAAGSAYAGPLKDTPGTINVLALSLIHISEPTRPY